MHLLRQREIIGEKEFRRIVEKETDRGEAQKIYRMMEQYAESKKGAN